MRCRAMSWHLGVTVLCVLCDGVCGVVQCHGILVSSVVVHVVSCNVQGVMMYEV